MRVMVSGPINSPVLLDTDKAQGILIQTDDGQPAVIFQMLKNGKGFIRYTKGEDSSFDEVAKHLGLG